MVGGGLDLAVVNLPVEDPEIDTSLLFTEELVLLATAASPLYGRTEVSFSELSGHPLVLPPPGTALRRDLDAEARRAGVTLRPQAEIDGVRLMASLAFEGYGSTIVPTTAVPGWLKGDFSRIPITDLALRQVGLARRRRAMLSASGARGRRRAAGGHRGQGSEAARRSGPGHAEQRRPVGPSAVACRLMAQASVALRAQAPGAVRAVVEHIDGRPVVVARMDASERRGALSSTASATLAEAARAAKDQRIPLVASIASSGADIMEGMAALHGWGQAARAIADCSGIVPVIIVLDGPAVSGPALLIGLADFVIMTEEAYAFVSGPSMVAEFTGVTIDNGELGGATIHAAPQRGGDAGGARRGRRRTRPSPSSCRTCRRTPTRSRLVS